MNIKGNTHDNQFFDPDIRNPTTIIITAMISNFMNGIYVLILKEPQLSQ